MCTGMIISNISKRHLNLLKEEAKHLKRQDPSALFVVLISGTKSVGISKWLTFQEEELGAGNDENVRRRWANVSDLGMNALIRWMLFHHGNSLSALQPKRRGGDEATHTHTHTLNTLITDGCEDLHQPTKDKGNLKSGQSETTKTIRANRKTPNISLGWKWEL